MGEGKRKEEREDERQKRGTLRREREGEER